VRKLAYLLLDIYSGYVGTKDTAMIKTV